jgi:hypothetical protein
MKETLKLPKKVLQDWIKRTGHFVKIGLKRANLRLKQGNRSITQFFQPTLHNRTNVANNHAGLYTPPTNNRTAHPPEKTHKENSKPP